MTSRILTKHNVEHGAKKYKTMVTECYMQDTKRYKCKFCHANFDRLGMFLNHTLLRHSTEEYLFNVTITPEQCRHVCSKCDIMFVSNSVLEYHTDKIHGERKIKKSAHNCEHCNETFKWNILLRRHSFKVHKIRMPFKNSLEANCKLCYKQFSSIGNYTAHVKSLHKSEEEKGALNGDSIDEQILLYLCQQCDKNFI